MTFSKLVQKDSIFYISLKKNFTPIRFENSFLIKDIINFANDMTFKSVGEHRIYRTGGSYLRKKGAIFSDTFQGKFAEFAVNKYFNKTTLNINSPNLEKYKLGKWDSGDMDFNGKKTAIKSAKHFSNLLLLERKDWDNEGNYIPNLGEKKIDLFIFVRVKPDISAIMKKLRLYFADTLNKNAEKILFEEINNNDWLFDIPGYATQEDIISIIKSNNIILKGQYLNSFKTQMDADNYYIQAGDLRNIETIKNFLE